MLSAKLISYILSIVLRGTPHVDGKNFVRKESHFYISIAEDEVSVNLLCEFFFAVELKDDSLTINPNELNASLKGGKFSLVSCRKKFDRYTKKTGLIIKNCTE